MSGHKLPIVVLDNGSGIIKIGRAGRAEPHCTLPALVGQKRVLQVGKPCVRRNDNYYLFTDIQADSHKDVNALSYPKARGFVTDWDDMTRLWTNAFHNMYIFKGDSLPTLITEPPLYPNSERVKTAEIMFEKLDVPSLCFQNTAVLNLLSVGLNTGVSLDLGDGITSAVTVYKGKVVANSIQRMDFGGRDLAKYLMKMLEKNENNHWPGYEGNHRTSNRAATRRYVTEAMEKYCYVAQNFQEEILKKPQEYTFNISDRKMIQMGRETFRCPEALFQPALVGLSSGGIHQMTCNAIENSEQGIRENLYENIVLCGGVAQLRGLEERLKKEITVLAPAQVSVNISLAPDVSCSAWKGGSCLAATSMFEDMLISKGKYSEAGPNAFL